jgi:hypothetical protein
MPGRSSERWSPVDVRPRAFPFRRFVAPRTVDGERRDMRVLLALAASLALLAAPAFARVTRELQGRTPKPPSRLQTPRLWSDQAGAFALERPAGDRWSFRSDAQGPDGEPLPLFAQSVESGAQLIVQSADGVTSLRALTRLLADHLGSEAGVRVQDVERVTSRGGEGYGFAFTVSDEARGRVAVVKAGDHVALVIASWPMGAPPTVADDIEEMIGTLGPPPGALPADVF